MTELNQDVYQSAPWDDLRSRTKHYLRQAIAQAAENDEFDCVEVLSQLARELTKLPIRVDPPKPYRYERKLPTEFYEQLSNMTAGMEDASND